MILQISPTRDYHQATQPLATRYENSPASRQRAVRRLAPLRSADRDTCKWLVEKYSQRMLAVARRLLRSDEDADDAVQDAFLAAFVSLHRFRAHAQIYTWLHRIVVNRCLMQLRSRRRRKLLSLNACCSDSEAGTCSIEAIATTDDHPCLLEQTESRLAVRRCIQQLAEDYREILILRDIEEFDTDQTAALLGLSRSATKTRLHRARQALRMALEQSQFLMNSD